MTIPSVVSLQWRNLKNFLPLRKTIICLISSTWIPWCSFSLVVRRSWFSFSIASDRIFGIPSWENQTVSYLGRPPTRLMVLHLNRSAHLSLWLPCVYYSRRLFIDCQEETICQVLFAFFSHISLNRLIPHVTHRTWNSCLIIFLISSLFFFIHSGYNFHRQLPFTFISSKHFNFIDNVPILPHRWHATYFIHLSFVFFGF